MNAGGEVGKGAANDDRGIVFGVSRARGRVEQEAFLIAVLGPAQTGAVHEPFVAGELLPEFDPVIGIAVLDDAQSAQAGGAGDVMRIDAIGAVGGDRQHIVRSQPIQIAFVTGVEMVVAGAGRSHRVIAVAILGSGSGARNAFTAGVPETGVVQSVIVSQFMPGYTGR